MKTPNIGSALLLAGMVTLPAFAGESHPDTARVISVTPQSERINTPRSECRMEYVREPSYDSGGRNAGGAILGGIAGGLLGSQVGDGNGRIAAAVIGAAVGAVTGERINNSGSNNSGYTSRPVERCTLVDNWQTVNRGYLVTYRYNGQDYTTVMSHDPGDTLRVRVSVLPESASRDVLGYAPDTRDGGWHRDSGRGRYRD